VNGNLGILTYAACGFLIVVYAWGRSNVPPANLRLVLLVYLALGGPLFVHTASAAHRQGGGLMVAGKIAHVQLVTIGMAVWLMQRHASFNRKPGDPPRFSAYLANSIIAAILAAGISFVFHSGDADPLSSTGRDLRVVLVSFPLCAAVAFFRDHWTGDTTRPAWLRRTETAGCVSVMALGIALLVFGELLPFATDMLRGWKLAVVIALSSALALMIGSCVPHTCSADDAGADGQSGAYLLADEDLRDHHRRGLAANRLVI
jgi:uncharacterized protein (DUF1330 family)